MKVSAKCNINFNGTWYKAGQEFEVSDSEYKEIAQNVEVTQETPVNDVPDESFVSEIFAPEEPVKEPRKRVRKKKTETE